MPTTPPRARIKNNGKFSPFWLLPFIALLIACGLFWSNYQQRGTSITIDFLYADGIVPGRTPVRYQGVDVGVVQKVRLADNLQTIRIQADIKREMKDALRDDTQFWLVTPKASLAGVSGLDALVGGNYIGMVPGKSAMQRDHFVALDNPPRYHVNHGELLIHLQAGDLGSLTSGSPVYYRKIAVGRVYDYHINQSGQAGVTINVLIDRRFAHLVKKESRFWNVSGMTVNGGLSGINIKMESLSALVNGAIAFDSPEKSPQASPNSRYPLYADLAQSQRGVPVVLDLTDGKNLQAGSTPLLYQGLQVGLLTRMTLQPSGRIKGEMQVDPSVADLLRENTRIEIQPPAQHLSDISLTSLLNGNTLALIPGKGAPRRHFTVLPAKLSLLQQAGVLTVTLSAAESFGIDVGQPVTLHGIAIGQVVQRQLNASGVAFRVAILPDYRRLVHDDSQFIVNSRLDVKFGLDGMQIQSASAGEWLAGGIRLEPGSVGAARKNYPLYSNANKARQHITGNRPPVTLTLSASSLPDIQNGSVVLYRQFQVGEIVSITPQHHDFAVAVYLHPEYRHLLTPDSIFWAEGSTKIQLNSGGLTVQASPLSRVLKGAISFDNLSGANVKRSPDGKRLLYESETAARAVGSQITLLTFDGSKLSPNMPIRYLGIDIGQVKSVTLSRDKQKVVAGAVLYPQYVSEFARKGSRFSVVTPEISAAGVSHLDTLLRPYINVEPGKGSAVTRFELQETTITDSRYLDGLNIVLDTAEAGSLAIGTPVLFRGIEIGTVTGTSLGSLADRVWVSLRISKKYQHLVRNNSVFWLASGYSLRFGLISGVVKTGTLGQFIRGGIQFATPATLPLAPPARDGKHFLLLGEEPKGWRDWGTAIMR